MRKITMLMGASLIFAATAMAGEKATPEQRQEARAVSVAAFEALDQNADQQISKSEADAEKALADSFAEADQNSDGYLNKSEYVGLSIS